MKFTLNTERSAFCTIDSFSFTFGEQTHDIDINTLLDEHKKQLLYNVNRGVLLSEDKGGLIALAKAVQPSTPIPQEQVPLQPAKVTKITQALVKDPIQEDLKPLRALLRKTVGTVKKEAATYRPSQIRKLLDLEKENKNRKSVLSFLSSILEQHERSVLNNIDTNDGPTIIDPMSIDPMRSTQVSDVVESEVEEIKFSQGDLLPQEVI